MAKKSANENNIDTIKKLVENGYNFGCLNCYKAFKQMPVADVPPGVNPTFCPYCGCDLFLNFIDKLEEIKNKEG